MYRLFSVLVIVATTMLLGGVRAACADVIVADDFFYNQPTKQLTVGGGFTLQDYGGGQNGPAGGWTGRWGSSGDGLVTGPDYEFVDDQFQGVIGDGALPLNANYIERGYVTSGLADNQTIYFGVLSRVDLDAVVSSRFYINDPLSETSQIALGFSEFGGFAAELGLTLDSNDDEFVNDGEFHQLIGKLEINAEGANERLTVWLDPVGVEAGPSVSIEDDVIASVSELDLMRLGRTTGGGLVYWDNVAIGTSWDSVAAVEIPRLTLNVNPTSGSAFLSNTTSTDFDVNYYEILSAGGSLNVDGWSSLDDQAVAGWLENSPSAARLTESNFSDATPLASGAGLNLGTLHAPGGAQDIVMRVGTAQGLLNLVTVKYEAGGVTGDFNGDGILDATDIDLLSAEVRAASNNPAYDLNADSLVNETDRELWVNDLKRTYFGDADLDGEFNSTDLVSVFQAGEYEDGMPSNSAWATGDWNGDTEFDTADFVTAFQAGGFELGPRPAVAAVPEPAAFALFLAGALAIVGRRRSR